MTSQSNNNFLCITVAILFFALLCGLIVLNSYLLERKKSDFRKADYCIATGFDFANGQIVTSKLIKREVIWTKHKSNSAYSHLYVKYNLGHDKPLVKHSDWQFYVKNYFISIDDLPNLLKDKDWWRHVWNWHFHIFDDILSNTANNGVPINAIFFNFLEENDLPIEEVQQAYKECIRLFDDDRKFTRFIFDFIDSHEKQATIDMVTQAAQTGELPNDADWFKMVNHIIKFRGDFPDDLPEAVMDKLLSVNLPVNGDLGNDMSFALYNYLLRPTEFNALHAALYETRQSTSKPQEENHSAALEKSFTILQKHELLEKFLSQVYSDDLETPPLPNAMSTDDKTYQQFPEREKLLKISRFPDVFRTYWEKRLKSIKEKDIPLHNQ